jgi:hypothetical protein
MPSSPSPASLAEFRRSIVGQVSIRCFDFSDEVGEAVRLEPLGPNFDSCRESARWTGLGGEVWLVGVGGRLRSTPDGVGVVVSFTGNEL